MVSEEEMAQSALAIAGEKYCAVGANRQNPGIAAAIAHASIPALVGLDPLVHSHIVSEQIERKHGETMPRLRTSRRLLASSIV
jgi:hypothetical protein